MRHVSIPGGGGGHGYLVSQTILSQEYSDGLAPEERDVWDTRYFSDSWIQD